MTFGIRLKVLTILVVLGFSMVIWLLSDGGPNLWNVVLVSLILGLLAAEAPEISRIFKSREFQGIAEWSVVAGAGGSAALYARGADVLLIVAVAIPVGIVAGILGASMNGPTGGLGEGGDT